MTALKPVAFRFTKDIKLLRARILLADFNSFSGFEINLVHSLPAALMLVPIKHPVFNCEVLLLLLYLNGLREYLEPGFETVANPVDHVTEDVSLVFFHFD